MADVDERQMQLESELYALSLDKLIELAEHLEIPVTKYSEKSKIIVLKVIREQIIVVISEFESDSAKLEELDALVSFIKDKPPPLDSHNANTDNINANPVINVESSNQTPQISSKSANLNHVDMSKVFRRDFKIKGQIGSPVDGNANLSFISLVRQIESAVKKGYDEEEIVEAVIQSICPGLPLRSYLESTPDLCLPRLRQILRSHYRENNAADLYQKLCSLTQTPQEDGSNFLLRALDLRQKIIFASKEADVAIRYNEDLVQSQFLHTIDMGLRNDGVRIRVQPLLRKAKVSDEELITEMNISVSQEAERKSKLSTKLPSENEKSSKSYPQQATSTDKPKKVNVVDTLLSEIESLRGTVNALMANQQQQQSNSYKPSTHKPRLCSNCQSQKKEKCEHCFHCGSIEHFARGCRNKPKANQGNQFRPPPRDK